MAEPPKSSLIRRAFFFWSTATPLATATLLTDVDGDDVDEDVVVGSRMENGLSELENPFSKSVLKKINFFVLELD